MALPYNLLDMPDVPVSFSVFPTTSTSALNPRVEEGSVRTNPVSVFMAGPIPRPELSITFNNGLGIPVSSIEEPLVDGGEAIFEIYLKVTTSNSSIPPFHAPGSTVNLVDSYYEDGAWHLYYTDTREVSLYDGYLDYSSRVTAEGRAVGSQASIELSINLVSITAGPPLRIRAGTNVHAKESGVCLGLGLTGLTIESVEFTAYDNFYEDFVSGECIPSIDFVLSPDTSVVQSLELSISAVSSLDIYSNQWGNDIEIVMEIPPEANLTTPFHIITLNMLAEWEDGRTCPAVAKLYYSGGG